MLSKGENVAKVKMWQKWSCIRTGIFFFSDYDKCAEEHRICLNGATCEQTWTSARCHCESRFQGARCDLCSERFHGDGCQECSPRFQGEECERCTERFEGAECDNCASGYYGNDCGNAFTCFLAFLSRGDNWLITSIYFTIDLYRIQKVHVFTVEISFTSNINTDCTTSEIHTMSPENSGNYDNCMEWCVARDNCGGIVIYNAKCYLKDTTCKNDMKGLSGAYLLVKTVN